MFTHPLEERCFLFAKRVRDFCRIARTSRLVSSIFPISNFTLNKELENEKLWLIGEALELRKIFSVIIQKLQNQENAVK